MRIGITFKLWLAATALVLVVVGTLGWAFDSLLVRFYYRESVEQLRHHAERYAEMWGAGQLPAAALAPMAGAWGVPVLVVDGAGRTLAAEGSLLLPPAQLQEKLARVLAGQTVTEGAPGGTDRAALLTVGVPIPGGGAVLMAASAEPVRRTLATLGGLLAVGAVGAGLLSAGLALLLAKSLTRPLLAAQAATRAIALGDFSRRVQAHQRDEMGMLGQAINAMAAELERLRQGRREFLANVAHELRTPLSYLRGYAQALTEGVVPPEEREGFLAIIREEADRLAVLVGDLLDLAQLDEGRLLLQQAAVELPSVLAGILTRLRPTAVARDITLLGDWPPGLPPVLADASRVEQCLVNLMDNALRHTPTGGLVTVSAGALGKEVRIAVTDSGSGIAAADLPRVWERFYRGTAGRAEGGSGRGLGLAIVRALVEAQGGRVGVESSTAGTTFWFTLPVAS